MPATSPLEVLETIIESALGTVTGLNSVKIAPFADAINVAEDGTVSLNRAALPEEYPGAIVSLNDEDITVTDEEYTIAPRQVKRNFRVPVFIAFYAHSDGTTEYGARRKVAEIAHAASAMLCSTIPTGAPEPWIFEEDEPLEPGPVTPIPIDAATHAMLVRSYAKYYILTP